MTKEDQVRIEELRWIFDKVIERVRMYNKECSPLLLEEMTKLIDQNAGVINQNARVNKDYIRCRELQERQGALLHVSTYLAEEIEHLMKSSE